MASMKGKAQPVGIGMTPSKTELGKFIRARRLELNLRQIPLAELAGLAQSFLSGLEIGTRKYLNGKQLISLAKALQVQVEELRKLTPVKPGSEPITELGKLIRSRREELGLSILAFANKLGITPQQAKKLEMKNPTLRYALVKPLASALKLDVSILVKFVGTTRKESKSKLGQLIRTRRKELGISTASLAEKLGVSPQFVNQIEFGQCRLSENDEMIVRLAQILELDVNKLKAVRPTRRLKKVDTRNPLSEFLSSKRLELRLTQHEIASRAKISKGAVCKFELGLLCPSSVTLDKLAKALGCEVPQYLKRQSGRRFMFT